MGVLKFDLSKKVVFNLNKVGPVELATTAFGQGVSVTPIQQTSAVSAVVNGGYLYQPYIVKNILESETNTIMQSNSKLIICYYNLYLFL